MPLVGAEERRSDALAQRISGGVMSTVTLSATSVTVDRGRNRLACPRSQLNHPETTDGWCPRAARAVCTTFVAGSPGGTVKLGTGGLKRPQLLVSKSRLTTQIL